MGFLSPIWFFALAALSIPLVIHLWNVKPGKTLKVGSISLISEASKASSRSLKLLNILLLILRCLLLALIAAFLAKPVWERITAASKSKGWILIPKENFKETYNKFKLQADSLLAKGYELHNFNKGFAAQDITHLRLDSAIADTSSNANYWGLIRQLDQLAPGKPVYVFTPNLLKNFKGSKPTVHLNLKWQTYTPADSVSKWIAAAAFTSKGDIKVTDGFSTPHGTAYTSKMLTADGDAAHTIATQNGSTSINLKDSKDAPVMVDTAAQRIAIYTDNYVLDAKYLNAALETIAGFTGAKINIKQYGNQAIPNGQTWLFWLSDKAVPAALAKNTRRIFTYANGKGVDIYSWIKPGDIALTKRIAVEKSHAQAIWTDGFGDAILTQQGGFYRFYTHFNPAWNDLVWSSDFPAMLLNLLQKPAGSQPNAHDRRILTDRQLQPDIVTQPASDKSIRINEQADISNYFWLLLVIVFAAERMVNYNIKQRENG